MDVTTFCKLQIDDTIMIMSRMIMKTIIITVTQTYWMIIVCQARY